MKLRMYLAFSLLVLIALVGGFYQPGVAAYATAESDKADIAWMLTATALVLLMTPGLSFFYGGMVNKNNVISTMLQSFVAMGVISILWVTVGFSLAFGESIGGVIGNPLTFLFFKDVGFLAHPQIGSTIPLALFALFQLKFAIITPALITGSFAQRVRFSSYLLFMCLFSMMIYAPLAHMTWHPDGLLYQLGILDFAGGTVVHMSAGIAALVGAIFLGRRQNSPEQPANIPFVLLGTGMLWFGWFGFNAGSALAADELAVSAFLTTNTASAAAMIAWLLFDGVRGRKLSALGACIGAVVGLVAITPAAGFVTVGQSIFIGVAASLVSNLVLHAQNKRKLDDTLDVFACHGVGGMVGMLLTGVFAAEGGLVTTGDATLFLKHCLALVVLSVLIFAGSYLIYLITNLFVPMRVSKEQERLGLDLSQHGEQII